MEALYTNIHQDIIDRCHKGDAKAQFQLYKLYYKPMYNVSLRMLGDPMEAEDTMQEAFLSAFTKIETYEGKVSFGAWLKKIVINRSLDQLKKRKVLFEEVNEQIQDEEEEKEVQEIDAALLKKAIEKLPDGYRVVLTLYLLEGYDHEEIAQIMGISNSSSRTQFLRAKRKLRGMLDKNTILTD